MPTVTGIATEFITFTRASNATVTDSDGKVKWAPHNLLTNSESFDAAAWTKTNIVTTGSWVNTLAAPNGTTTADLLRPSTVSTTHHAISGNLSSNATVTYAVYAYAGGYTKFGIRESGSSGAYASFDLTGSGSVLASASAGSVTMSNPQITPIGGGWFRASVTFVVPSGISDQLGIWVLPDSYTTGDPAGTNWSGDGTKGIYVWGAHVYRSDLGGMQPNTSAYPMYNPTTPKNLAGFTEDFSGTGWTRVNLLANGSGSVANAVLNPVNGLQTADLIVESTANGYHSLYRSFTSVITTPYLWSAYVKPAGRTIVQIAAQATANVHIVEFNLTGSGTATTRSGSGTAAITALSDGWYRISTIATATGSGTAYWQVDLCSAANTNSYTGDGVSGIYLWGAQLSDSASLDPYVPVYGAAVTSAAYYGPRRDFDGATLACKGLLVEEQRANLVLRSAEFDNATNWTLLGGSVTANASTAPDGTYSADKVVEDTSTGAHAVYQSINFAASTAYTVSIFAKVWERSRINLFANAVSATGFNLFDCTFNLSTGVATATQGTPTITAVGNGWYRCTVSNTMGGSASTANLQIRLDNGTTTSYTGVTGNGALIYGAQVEAGSFATSYIPTGAATATRNADVASVSTQAFPYSASTGSLIANISYLAGTATRANAEPAVTLEETNSKGVSIYNGGGQNAFYVRDGGTDVAYLQLPPAIAANTPVKVAGAYALNDFAAAANGGTVLTDTSGTPPTANLLRLGNWNSVYFCGHIRQITYLPRRISNAELVTRST